MLRSCRGTGVNWPRPSGPSPFCGLHMMHCSDSKPNSLEKQQLMMMCLLCALHFWPLSEYCRILSVNFLKINYCYLYHLIEHNASEFELSNILWFWVEFEVNKLPCTLCHSHVSHVAPPVAKVVPEWHGWHSLTAIRYPFKKKKKERDLADAAADKLYNVCTSKHDSGGKEQSV